MRAPFSRDHMGFTLNHIIRLLDRHQSEFGWLRTFILQSWCGHIFDGFYFDGHICDGLPFSFISWSESSEHIFVPLVEAAFQAILGATAWEMILIMVKILTFDRNYNQKVLAHFSSVCSHRLVTLFAQWDGSSAASFILLLRSKGCMEYECPRQPCMDHKDHIDHHCHRQGSKLVNTNRNSFIAQRLYGVWAMHQQDHINHRHCQHHHHQCFHNHKQGKRLADPIFESLF